MAKNEEPWWYTGKVRKDIESKLGRKFNIPEDVDKLTEKEMDAFDEAFGFDVLDQITREDYNLIDVENESLKEYNNELMKDQGLIISYDPSESAEGNELDLFSSFTGKDFKDSKYLMKHGIIPMETGHCVLKKFTINEKNERVKKLLEKTPTDDEEFKQDVWIPLVEDAIKKNILHTLFKEVAMPYCDIPITWTAGKMLEKARDKNEKKSDRFAPALCVRDDYNGLDGWDGDVGWLYRSFIKNGQTPKQLEKILAKTGRKCVVF